jgi:type VI secretion system VasD/TssJ family lipoprotein
MVKVSIPFFSWHSARVFSILALVLVVGGFYGCAGSKDSVKKEIITLTVNPDSSSNDGRPVYIVIRKANIKNFLAEDYDTIVDIVHAEPSDETLLAWRILLPGKQEKIEVVKPDKSSLGVYVLFTNPGENWKMMFEIPLESKYNINVKRNVLEDQRKRAFW